MNTVAFVPYAGFRSDYDSSDEEECSSNNQNKDHVESVSAKKRTSRIIKPKIPYSHEKTWIPVGKKVFKKKIGKKKCPKRFTKQVKCTQKAQKREKGTRNTSPEHVLWKDRTFTPIAPFDTTRTNGITPKEDEIYRMIEKVRKCVLEALKEKEEAIQNEVNDCLAFFSDRARAAKENNFPVPRRRDENFAVAVSADELPKPTKNDEGDIKNEENREVEPKPFDTAMQVDVDSIEELESEYNIGGNYGEKEEESDNDSHHTDTGTDNVDELSVESGKYTLSDEVLPMKVEYFMPLGNTIQGEDELQLRNLPLLYHDTDDIAVCSEFYKIYPCGIRGYEPNAYEISEQLLFEIMKKALPRTTSADSELLYYALYRLFPNCGSQKDMSLLFPKLVKLFARDDAKSTAYLSLETWKIGREEYEEEEEKPIDWKHSCSEDNFFVKLIRLPSQDDRIFCSDECYKSMNMNDLIDVIGELPMKNVLELNISKNGSSKPESLFLDFLMLKDESRFIVDFCGAARQFKHQNNRTCLEWFEFLLDIANNLEETDGRRKHERTFHNKQLSFNIVLNKEKIKDTIFAISPCCHFGPCGPTAENCSCDLFCSVYCQCDEDCVRKFPGCQCPPSQCRTKRCACRAIGWECIEKTCSKCHDPSYSTKCRNSCATRIEDKEVRVGRSNIAGNGLFLAEDVEKGDFLGVYIGEFISAEESDRRGKVSYFGNNYLFGLPNTCETIDSSRAGNVWRFSNHADVPNCSFKYAVVQGLPSIKFYAAKAMKEGEELTISYGNPDSVELFLHDSALEDRLPKWDKKPTVHQVKEVVVADKEGTRKELKKRVSLKKTKIQKRPKIEEDTPCCSSSIPSQDTNFDYSLSDIDCIASTPSCSSDVTTSCQFVYKGFANNEDDESGYSD